MSPKPLRIQDTPIRSRPRERLIAMGAAGLRTSELLMTILGTGIKGAPVAEVAKKLTIVFEETPLQEIRVETLTKIRGVGNSKACAILAMLELAERLHMKEDIAFTSPSIVWSLLQTYAESSKEHLICLYLNARYQLVHREVLAIGSLNQLMIFPRDVFAPIKNFPIVNIILAHNHPSGDPSPSEDDVVFTKKMKEASALLGIELLDHIIITKKKFVSLKEQKLLEAI